MLEEARRVGASDLHVVAGRPALFRVAGELKPDGEVLGVAKVEQWLRALVPERLRPVLEREGSCDFAHEHPSFGRFRVSVSRQRTGLKGSFRLVTRELPTLPSLGLPLELTQATRAVAGDDTVEHPVITRRHEADEDLLSSTSIMGGDTIAQMIDEREPGVIDLSDATSVLPGPDAGTLEVTGLMPKPDFAIDAEAATSFLCAARTEEGKIVFALVDRKSPGITVTPHVGFFVSVAEVRFNQVAVAPSQLLGSSGASWATLLICPTS